MPNFALKCKECRNNIEVTIAVKDIKESYRRKCPVCEGVRTFTRDWSAGVAAYHNHLSPMHPRVNRGRGY